VRDPSGHVVVGDVAAGGTGRETVPADARWRNMHDAVQHVHVVHVRRFRVLVVASSVDGRAGRGRVVLEAVFRAPVQGVGRVRRPVVRGAATSRRADPPDRRGAVRRARAPVARHTGNARRRVPPVLRRAVGVAVRVRAHPSARTRVRGRSRGFPSRQLPSGGRTRGRARGLRGQHAVGRAVHGRVFRGAVRDRLQAHDPVEYVPVARGRRGHRQIDDDDLGHVHEHPETHPGR